jgi:ribosomal protein S12 methylthiotransferase accessory factor
MRSAAALRERKDLPGLAALMGAARQSSELAAHVYYGDDPAAAGQPARDGASHPLLLVGVGPHRIRVGPIVGMEDGACLDCLSYWIDHNRPEAELWRSLPEVRPPSLDTLPWPPVVVRLIEVVSSDFTAGPAPARFVDIDPKRLTVHEHFYQPSPGCPRCAPRPADSPAFARAPDRPIRKPAPNVFRARALPAIAELRGSYVDYRVGLVRHMYRDTSSEMLPMWGAENKLPGLDLAEVGYGRHESARTAEAVAILEALERYCGFVPASRRASVRSSYAEMTAAGLPAVDPRGFILGDPAQRAEPGYALAAWTPDLLTDWLWAWSCRNGAPVLVPQQFGFADPHLTPSEERFVRETSNGSALGGSFEEAVFHGLLEVIERDAYMTRWHVQGTPRRIELDDPEMPDVRRLNARAVAEGYELHAFAIGVECPVPTVLAMIVDPREDAGVASYCASGAHPVAASAIMGALVEVCSSIGVYQSQFAAERDRARALLADSSQVQEMRDHVLLYSAPEAIERLSFLDRRAPAASASTIYGEMEKKWRGDDLTAELDRLIAAVLTVADDVIVIDQHADLLDRFGLHCVKVLAPGLHPITFGHQYRRIGPARLARARHFLEKQGERCVAGVNPFPHNFP